MSEISLDLEKSKSFEAGSNETEYDEFILGIVIPLKSKAVSKSWTTVCDSLNKTLRSIENQHSRKFTVIIVCHDEPSVDYSNNEWCHIVQVDIPVPVIEGKSSAEKQELYEIDRTAKLEVGANLLVDRGATHIFALDADDLLHYHFVNEVESRKEYGAIVLKNGYLNFQSYKLVNKISSFDVYCGSCCIVSKDNLYLKVKNGDSLGFVFRLISHAYYARTFEKRGIATSVPDKPIVMYMKDNGENISSQGYDLAYDTIQESRGGLWARAKVAKRYVFAKLRSLNVSQNVMSDFGL